MSREQNDKHQARNGFKGAKELVQYLLMVQTLTPLARLTAMAHVWPLKHRGKGRGAIEHMHGEARSKYMPHQGDQECARRYRQLRASMLKHAPWATIEQFDREVDARAPA